MIYDVRVAKQARHDMKMVYEYIADVLLEPVTAEKQYTRIENAIYTLDHMPERFRQYEKEPWRSRNLRIMPVDNYLVFYLVDNKKRTATVIRVMYGRRNIEKELDDMARRGGNNAFMSLRETAKNNGVQDWSLDEINNEINAARRDRDTEE